MVFFCFLTSSQLPENAAGTSTHAREGGVARLDGSAVRDGDASLGGTRRRAEGLDLLHEVHAFNNLTCKTKSSSGAFHQLT